MSLFTNGLPAVPRALGLPSEQLRRALAGTHDPNMVGAGMVLAARTQPAYAGTVDPATVARRRAANKRARKARRAHR